MGYRKDDEESDYKIVIWKNDDNKWEWNIELAAHIDKGRISTSSISTTFNEAYEEAHKALASLKRKEKRDE